ncbi:cysteine-rich CWC family protein [Shewanella denitrificans]|nr:cysteine-rich CWC family protein [Shewanella denitrificans]
MTAEVTKFSPKESLTQTADTCPLCQQANLCAATTNTPIAACWCQSQTFPPKAVLATSQQAKLTAPACICQSCLVVLKQQ